VASAPIHFFLRLGRDGLSALDVEDALLPALSFAAFVLALAGRPTWGLRGVAVGLVVLVVSIVMAWNLGFQAGAGAKDDEDP
jgi:hypothetical protein